MLNQLQDFTPQATHLDNSPVTKVSPPKSAFPKSNTGDEQKFNIICEELKDTPGLQLADKKPIEWDKRDPLHFWQSLALVLRSEDLVCIAVSSFVDKEGQNKLYFASNRQMNDAQKEDIRDITSMFMELQPEEEIAYRVFPRQLPYIIKQFNKIYVEQTKVFEAEVPSPLGEIAKEIQNLKQKVEAKAIVVENKSSKDRS
ncbi:hypothetical protein MP638_000123 [Amoeboaphelidium occidentale]|nr:hypothetical protein MP638_000123 [Amoeboaphelidium occidentale]